MKRRVSWDEKGMDTNAFQKPDRFGGPPKVQLEDDQDRPENGKAVKTAKSGDGSVASAAKSAKSGGGRRGGAEGKEGWVMETFSCDQKGEKMSANKLAFEIGGLDNTKAKPFTLLDS